MQEDIYQIYNHSYGLFSHTFHILMKPAYARNISVLLDRWQPIFIYKYFEGKKQNTWQEN